MCDFQPGDVVVCIDARDIDFAIGGVVPVEVGRNYIVRDVGPAEDDEPIVRVEGASAGPDDTWGWDHEMFRRVYRPKADLISKLLEPVDLFSEAKQ